MSGLGRSLAANPRLSRWVRVGADGTVELRVGKVELGQGILTAVAQIAADELGVPLARIAGRPAHTGEGPDEGLTAGSMSVMESGAAVRMVAADVRSRFAAEAARRWQVPVEKVRVCDGVFSSPETTETLGYGDLCGAVDLDVDVDPDVAVTAEGGLVGTSVARVDLPAKVDGTFRYIADLRPEGLLFGRVLRPPGPGYTLEDVDESVMEPGASLHRDGSFLGVVAPDEHTATRALARLAEAATWAPPEDGLPDPADLRDLLLSGPHEVTRVLDEAAEPRGAGRLVEARYSKPFLAHASMAPSCGIARWDDAGVHVWSHSQGIHRLRDAIAQALSLDAAAVVVEHVQNAGSYGHNAADDAAFDAVLLARAFPGRPVQVRWSRQDELAWGPFGPAMVADVAGTLDPSGRLVDWRYDVYSQGHGSRPGYAGVPGLLASGQLADPWPLPAPQDPPLAAGAGTARNAVPLYDVGTRRVTAHRTRRAVLRSSSMRSLGAFMNVFAIDSFMDEAAAATGADPVEFRLRHLRDDRARAVLETAAERSGWGTALPDGFGRGVGLARYKDKGAYCAVVATVRAEQDVRLTRLTIAVDVGRVVNPDGVRNQIEGGALQASSWTTKEQVTFDRSRVTSQDWESYPILRFSETPEVEVHVLDRPDLPSVGAGEAAQGPTAAAIANAVADAIGVRVRDLPLTADAVVRAIEANEPTEEG